MAMSIGGSAAASAVSAPANATATAAGAAAAPAPGTAGFSYLVGGVGGPDAGFWPTLTDRGGVKAPAASIPAAAVGVSSREKAPARRRRRATLRGYGDEFADMEAKPAPDSGNGLGDESGTSTIASDHDAGTLGFAGTARKADGTQAVGLTTLASDALGGGPTVPMMPGGCDAGPDEPGEVDVGGREPRTRAHRSDPQADGDVSP